MPNQLATSRAWPKFSKPSDVRDSAKRAPQAGPALAGHHGNHWKVVGIHLWTPMKVSLVMGNHSNSHCQYDHWKVMVSQCLSDMMVYHVSSYHCNHDMVDHEALMMRIMVMSPPEQT